MANVAQLVRASGCGSEGRGFDPHHSPHIIWSMLTLCGVCDTIIRYGPVAQLVRAPAS